MKKLLSLFLVVVALAGCSSCINCPAARYCGTYQGILPAASNPGIRTTLTLEPNGNFYEEQVYIDVKDAIFYNQGTYTVNNNVITLRPVNGEVSYYQIEKGQLRRLNMSGHIITGALANNYVLKRL